MMDKGRLFFEDAYRTEFGARVVGRVEREGRAAVILDQTCFYPESGGQPWDMGTLNGVPVVQVVEEGESILHVLAAGPGSGLELGEPVAGQVDWPRRFDHMQQHTGQHILSQAFVEVLRGETRSFHLGAEVSTLEVALEGIDEPGLKSVERRANEIVFRNLEVKAYSVAAENIGDIPLRRPPKKEGTIRVVEVAGFDYSACGGTHCRRTGEVGLIKVTRWDKIRGNLRFEFLCGARALEDYSRKAAILRGLSGSYSVAENDVPASVEKTMTDLKACKKAAKSLQERTARLEASDMIREAKGRIFSSVFDDRTAEEVKALAFGIVRQTSAVVLFAARGTGPARVIMTRSDDIALDLRELIPVFAARVAGKGGGGPSLVELVAAEPEGLAAALKEAAVLVNARLS